MKRNHPGRIPAWRLLWAGVAACALTAPRVPAAAVDVVGTFTAGGLTAPTFIGVAGQSSIGLSPDGVQRRGLLFAPARNPPLNHVPGAQVVRQNGRLVFSSNNRNAISVSDDDAGTSRLQIGLRVQHGTLTLGSNLNLSVTAGRNNSASLTISGPLSSLNAALNGLTYTPVANYLGSDSLTLDTNDAAGGGAAGGGAVETATSTVALNVIRSGNSTSPAAVLRLGTVGASVATNSVQLQFNGGLAAESASDGAQYSVEVNGHAVTVESAGYDATTHAVTLSLPEGTLHVGDQVMVRWNGLGDAIGREIAGGTGPLRAQ